MENRTVEILQPGTYHFYEGDSPKFREPKPVTFTGNIFAVNDFLKSIKPSAQFERPKNNDWPLMEPQPDTSIVFVDSQQKAITLYLNPHDPAAMVIVASLRENKDLVNLGINTSKVFTREELVKKLRYSAHLFTRTGDHAALLTSLQRFNADITGKTGAGSDNRGNRSMEFQKNVAANLPERVSLTAPVFSHTIPMSFLVELCFDVSDAGGAKFWLESPELDYLQTQDWEKSIDGALDCAKNLGLKIIAS